VAVAVAVAVAVVPKSSFSTDFGLLAGRWVAVVAVVAVAACVAKARQQLLQVQSIVYPQYYPY
jgi:hypothetical protein